MSGSTLPSEAWWCIAVLAGLSVLMCLRLLARRIEDAIKVHQLQLEAVRLREEYARRLAADASEAAASIAARSASAAS